ncbi:uncharacterized protein LOC130451291 [Diorhabda sublineata]|uniref:uncharacterized protein LOC130451291 n=1 Tax=Diorhabda sublineata TaxID=1163346 RepID=UPI0024E08A96|nr:uncharacterized protein LOC130451291 [Diorhabda sublineata]
MDFLDTLRINYSKLKDENIVNILWKEILKEERSEEYLDLLIEYSFHYPVDSDSYLEELIQKFDEVHIEDLRKIDGHLKAYLITFLYYCTNRYSCRVPAKTTVLASTLYIKLISLSNIGKFFFEKSMLKLQLMVFLDVFHESSVSELNRMNMLKVLKEYCLKEKLDIIFLKAVINTFIGVTMIATKEVVQGIKDVQSVQLYCMNSIKDIVLHEENDNNIKCMMGGLFRCLGKNIPPTVQNKTAARSVIKVLIRDILQEELDQSKFQFLLEAFCISWGKEDFNCYEDAVAFMNMLRSQYYKELVRKMVSYTQSKYNKKIFLSNVMNLLVAMANSLPTFNLDKIAVLYSCALRNIVYYFLDKDKKLVDKAVETMAKICLMKDNALVNLIFSHVSGNGKFVNMKIESLLLGINTITDEKWGVSQRNQNLFIIVARFLSSSRGVNSDLVQKTLNAICKDFTPFSLKPSLPILHELYCVLALKEEIESAQTVLKILFKSAMHQDAVSVKFAEHIFYSMLKPSVIDSISYDPKYYYNMFLTSNFDYELLFSKCQRLIQPNQIDNVIKEFDYEEPGAAVLLCCLLNYCKYEDSTVFAEYFIENFSEIAIRPMMGPLSIAFRKIIINRTITVNDAPQLNTLHSFLLKGFYEQTYQVPCIKPAFDLMQEIRRLLQIDIENQFLNQLLETTSERAFRRMHRREIGDLSVFMYLNELCILTRKLPTEDVVRFLIGYMKNPIKIEELKTFMPDIYLQLLTLFTTMAMLNKKKVPLALKYLKDVLTDESQITKILGFKLYYSLCKEMTHEFEEVISFSFREIVVADPCLTRLCIIAIEELVHHDFIKLEADNFFRFIYALGYDELTIFMKDILEKRFMLSNQNDITKYYVQTIMYMHTYSKMPNYPISNEFMQELVRMKLRLNCKNEIPVFLFSHLPIKKKFNVLQEIACIFDDIVRGHCKIEVNFFPMLTDLILTFRFMKKTSTETKIDKNYYNYVCKEIQKKIVKFDASYKGQSYYNEFETEIRKCTLSLLNLLFLENKQIADGIQIILFDALMHWIDFVLQEIIAYIHIEKGRDYAQYFSKLVQYFKRNQSKFGSPSRQ